MKKKDTKTQYDFFQLGYDFRENGLDGKFGEYVHGNIKTGIEFSVKMHVGTGETEYLVYLTNLPALLKQSNEFMIGYMNNYSSVVSCEYGETRKEVYTCVVNDWDEFVEEFSKTSHDNAKLTQRLKETKKKYGIEV